MEPRDERQASQVAARLRSAWRAVALIAAFAASWKLPGDPLDDGRRKVDALGRPLVPPAQTSGIRRVGAFGLLLAAALLVVAAADSGNQMLFAPAVVAAISGWLLLPARSD